MTDEQLAQLKARVDSNQKDYEMGLYNAYHMIQALIQQNCLLFARVEQLVDTLSEVL